MKTIQSIIIVIAVTFAFTACHKEGTGGKAAITGYVKHHDVQIPSAIVYIKYGAIELPGINASDYDDQTVAGSGDGYYEIGQLQKGNYYLYSTGYDSTQSGVDPNVFGGIPVKIKKKTEKKESDIAVTEK